MNPVKNKSKSKQYGKRGNPFKRGKTWTYIVYVPDDIGIKRPKWVGGFKTEKEASEALKVAEAALLTDIYETNSKKTFATYADLWFMLRKRELRPGTIQTYIPILKKANNILGKRVISKIQVNDIIRFDQYLQSLKLKQSTINTHHEKIRAILRSAFIDGDIRRNPYDKFKLQKAKSHKSITMNLEEMKKFLVVAKKNGIYFEILLAVTTGMRRGEILGLQFKDFDFDNKCVQITKQIAQIDATNKQRDSYGIADLKTEKSFRTISVPDAVLQEVKRIKLERKKRCLKEGTKFRESDFVSINRYGQFNTPPNLTQRFKHFLVTNGLPDMRLHDLRHTFATICLNNNIPLLTISSVLGHSKIATTADIYCEVKEVEIEPTKLMNSIIAVS